MSKELQYTLNPKVTYIKWGVVYVLLAALLATIFLLVAGRIHTYRIPKGSFELSIPYAKYVVGDTVTFTLKNNFNSQVTVANDCPHEPLAVYRLENSTWTRVHDVVSLDSCPTKERQIVLAAGGQQSGSFAAWKNLFATPGKYRVVAYVDYFNAVPYQDFEIIAKPAPTASSQVQTNYSTGSETTNPPQALSPPRGEENVPDREDD